MGDHLHGLFEKLQEKEYKITPQRRIILQTFIQNAERHLSADDVFNLVKREHPEVGLATVYRTLDLFANVGILQKLDFGDGRSRYEFTEENELHHHHHLICVRCGRVQEVEDDLLESLEAMIARKKRFQIIDHDVKFFGYCEECR